MRTRTLLFFAVLQSWYLLHSQDTFSILAFDSITGEVGGAGASCVDLNGSFFSNDFIIELFPNEGAIATQASYITANQVNARNRFTAGDSPTQLLSFMQANDIASDPSVRQYGVIRRNTGYPKATAFTGTNCMAYKNHIVGPNYTIQGNILLGQMVLDSMESRFKREPGDLACKLMAAMQGAKMVGADTRCSANGSSSLFAFLKVSQPTDPLGQSSFLISLKTANGAGLEPIDSLQVLFNAQKSCTISSVGISEKSNSKNDFFIYPNPAEHSLNIKTGQENGLLIIRDALGKILLEKTISESATINTTGWQKGIYFVEFEGKSKKLSLADK